MKIKTNNKSVVTYKKAPLFLRAFGLDKESRQDAKDKSIVEFLGYKNCSPDGILDAKDGTKARFLSVHSTDLYSLDSDTRAKYLDAFTTFNRVYAPDYKIVVLSTRTDTTDQQLYWQHKKNQLRKPKNKYDQMRLKLINENLFQAVALSRDTENYADVKFYFQIFGENRKDILTNTRNAYFADAQGQGLLGLKPLNYDSTVKVLFRENNLNSK
ncbi:hypothetical protein SAMN04487792_1627 [Lactobacillus bombicola]|uniref:Uncharacterized protein n=1 Tax=Lactobacillus bombicola TaxID=1505723 RepID=A0A1I1TU87_9LACO|nr:hypothetical protein [Lactobacillus bombicola]SFD62246.1 hypothetical protein SAMN04487792_1627 [Lactobacillus bombicola]